MASSFSNGDVPDGSARTDISYFEGHTFKSQHTDSPTLIMVYLIPTTEILGERYLTLGHDRHFSHPSQIINSL